MNLRRCLAVAAPEPEDKLAMLSHIAQEHSVDFNMEEFSQTVMIQTETQLATAGSEYAGTFNAITGNRFTYHSHVGMFFNNIGDCFLCHSSSSGFSVWLFTSMVYSTLICPPGDDCALIYLPPLRARQQTNAVHPCC